MAKITFRKLLEIESESKNDFISIDTHDSKLLSVVKEFADNYVEAEVRDCILNENVSVIVNGTQRQYESLPFIYIKKDTEIIITPKMTGGKIGSLIGLVLGVALIAVGLPPVTFFPESMGPALIMMGAGMILSSLAMLIFAPTLPKLPELEGEEETKTYSWNGIRTLARADVPIPILIGTHKIGGYIISLYTQSRGRDNYLYMLLAYSEGEVTGICQSRDYSQVCITSNPADPNYEDPAIFLNEQPINKFESVRWWARNGLNEENASKDQFALDSQNPIPYFNDIRVQYNDGREIPDEDGITFTTHTEVDKIEVNLYCPNLYHAVVRDDTTVLDGTVVYYKIYYRRNGETTWIQHTPTLNRPAYACRYATVDDDGNWSCLLGGIASRGNCNNINKECSFTPSKYAAPPIISKLEYYNGDSYWSGMGVPSKDLRIRFVNIDKSESSDKLQSIDIEVEVFENKQYFSDKFVVRQTRIRHEDWLAHPMDGGVGFLIGWPEYSRVFSGFKLTFENLSNITTYDPSNDQTIGLGEIILISYQSVSSSEWNQIISKGGRDPYYSWEEIEFPVSDKYDIKVIRYGKTSNSAVLVNEIKLASYVEIINEELIYPNTALLGLEIKATRSLSGSPPNVTFVAKGIKSEVPQINSGSVNFDDCWYDPSSDSFVDSDGSNFSDSIGTDWDDTTLVEEYTENFAAITRTILLNERYGTGKYIKRDDLAFNYWIEALKDCHIVYDPYNNNPIDYFDWWNTGNDTDWDSRIELMSNKKTQFTVDNEVYHTLIKDVDNRKIETNLPLGNLSAYSYPYSIGFIFNIKTNQHLVNGNKYILTITLNNMNTETDIGLAVNVMSYYSQDKWYNIYNSFQNGSPVTVDANHKITIEFTLNAPSTYGVIDCMKISLVRYTTVHPIDGNALESDHLTGEITDISLREESLDHFHTANGIVEKRQTADSFFTEMCHSFRCWLLNISKKIVFRINKDEDPVCSIGSSDISQDSFSQNFVRLSQIPYALDAQFTNAFNNYEMASRTVIVGLPELNRASRKLFGLKYIVSPAKIERELIYHANVFKLCDCTVNLKLDVESIRCTAGDIVQINDELTQWDDGRGGRIISYDSSTKTITIDDDYTFDGTSNYQIIYHDSNNELHTCDVMNSDETTNQIIISTWPADPVELSSFMLGKTGFARKFRLLSTSRTKDNMIQLVGLLHDPNMFDLSDASIIQSPFIDTTPLNYEIKVKNFSAEFVSPSHFKFYVETESNEVFYTNIQYSMNPTDGFVTISQIYSTEHYGSWFVNDLIFDTTYYFRAISYNSKNVSDPVVVSVYVSGSNSAVAEIPTGIQLFGSQANTQEFNTKNVTFIWNVVKGNSVRYIINIYKDSVSSSNLIVDHRIVSENRFTYSLSDNITDSGGTPSPILIIEIASIINVGQNSIISEFCKPVEFINSVPSQISGLTSTSIVGGAIFSWDQSSEKDHKCYYIRTKVGTGNWSDWFEFDSNSYTYQLTNLEIETHGVKATIYIEIKDKDWYEQLSVSATSSSCVSTVVSDSIFSLTVNAESGSGDLTELYDGDTSSGGWIIG